MATAERLRRRPWVGLLVPAALAFALLIGLGVWQLQRKVWKENLIAEMTRELSAPPVALPPPTAWRKFDRAGHEYHRVRFSAELDYAKEARVFFVPSTLRPDVSGPGYWILTPAHLAGGGTVMVNRGFLPAGRQNLEARPKSRPGEQFSAPIEITGALRWPDARHWFTPNDEPQNNLWFTADPASIAAAKGIGPVASFYVEQESPVPPGGLPKPGKLVVRLPDNHLQYALTWFGLALVLAIWFTAWAYGREREAMQAETPTSPGARHSL